METPGRFAHVYTIASKVNSLISCLAGRRRGQVDDVGVVVSVLLYIRKLNPRKFCDRHSAKFLLLKISSYTVCLLFEFSLHVENTRHKILGQGLLIARLEEKQNLFPPIKAFFCSVFRLGHLRADATSSITLSKQSWPLSHKRSIQNLVANISQYTH